MSPAPHGGAADLADWRESPEHVRIVLQDMEVDVRCGLHPWERHPEHPNRLIINVEMFAGWPLKHGGDGAYVDYDRVRRRVVGWRDREHVELLETLLEELVQICFEDENVEACRVSAMKPDIFRETRAAGVEMFRRRPGG